MNIFISFIIGLFFFVSPVLAQSPTPTPIQDRLKEEIQQFRQNVLERKEEEKKTINIEKAKARTQLQNLRNASQDEIRRRKEEFRALEEQRKEEFKTRLDEAKAKAKEQAEAKRVELKNKLQGIRNEQKKRIVERVAQQLNELNERMMNHFSNILDRLEKTLVNIKSRTDKAEAKGWNVSAVRTMITSAEGAITSARLAVEVQAGKTYTPTISGQEGSLKVEVGRARQALHNDLAAVREKVRAAFEAVRRVATTLAQVPRVDEDETPTPSPSLTPTPTATPTPTPTPTP